MRRLLRAVHAFWMHDLSEQLSYPMLFVQRLITGGTLLFLLYYGSALVDGGQVVGELGAPYFLFALSGIAVLQLLNACLGSFSTRIRRYQLTGLLEACLMTRTPLWQVLLAMPVFDLAFAFTRSGAVVLLGLVVAAHPVGAASLAVALVFVALGVAVFLALGLISSALTLVLKGGEPVGRIMQLASVTVSGAFVPRSVLPDWLAAIGEFVPIAPVLDGVRGALFDGLTLGGLLEPLLRVCLLAGFLVPVALVVARWGLYRVLRDGSLAHY